MSKSDKHERVWEVTDLENNHGNYLYDEDDAQVECPDPHCSGWLTLGHVIQFRELVCERCGASYELLLRREGERAVSRQPLTYDILDRDVKEYTQDGERDKAIGLETDGSWWFRISGADFDDRMTQLTREQAYRYWTMTGGDWDDE